MWQTILRDHIISFKSTHIVPTLRWLRGGLLGAFGRIIPINSIFTLLINRIANQENWQEGPLIYNILK